MPRAKHLNTFTKMAALLLFLRQHDGLQLTFRTKGKELNVAKKRLATFPFGEASSYKVSVRANS
jgi:hypothetical protein